MNEHSSKSWRIPPQTREDLTFQVHKAVTLSFHSPNHTSTHRLRPDARSPPPLLVALSWCPQRLFCPVLPTGGQRTSGHGISQSDPASGRSPPRSCARAALFPSSHYSGPSHSLSQCPHRRRPQPCISFPRARAPSQPDGPRGRTLKRHSRAAAPPAWVGSLGEENGWRVR